MKKRLFSSLRSQMLLLTVSTILVVLILASVFYSNAQRLSEQKAATFVHSMLVQLGDSLDRVGNEMAYLGNALHANEVLQQYYHAPTTIQRMQYGQNFIDFTSSLLNHSPTVSHIVVVNNDQSVLSPTEQNIIALDTLDSKYHLFDSDNLSSGFYGPAFDTFTNLNFFAYVQPVFNTRPGARFNQKLGTCVVFARLDLLQATLVSALPTPDAVLLLIGQDDQIILCSGDGGDLLAQLPASFYAQISDDCQQTFRLSGTTYLSDSLLLSSMGWRLVSLVPEDEIAADLMPLLWLGMLICVAFAICIGIWSFHIQRSIMSPLTQLTAFIENDLDDKLQNRIHINTNSEMALFCQEINTLLDKVSEMTAERLRDQTRLYEMSLAKKRAELSALQSQINPHFLYNTLDCIRGYGYLLNSQEIVSITNALSSIMRYCIKGSDTVALQQEMTVINYYLDIIRIRFPNRFNYVFDVDPALEELSIPRFILQPVVENAIYHGLESRLAKGTLTISCHMTDKGDCALCVTDDGVGIPPDRLAEIHSKLSDRQMQNVLNVPAGNSLGLVNIHNRLRTLYGANYGLDIVCPAEGGTRVTLRVPMTLLNQPAQAQKGQETHHES